MSTMKIKVDWGRCEGNGACVVAAPELFDLDDDDNLVVFNETPPEELRKKLEEAVARCPKHALAIEE